MPNSPSPPAEVDERAPDYFYSLLGVSKTASEEEIKNAYRRLCILYHPDKHLEGAAKSAAALIFDKINRAYSTLSNAKLRQIYDEWGERGLVAAQQLGAYLDGDLEALRVALAKSIGDSGWRNKTTLSAGIDTSMLMEDWSPIADQMTWSDYVPSVNSFVMSHRSEGIVSDIAANINYSLVMKNGSGTGTISTTLSRQLSERLRGRLECSLGGERRAAFGLTAALTSKMTMDLITGAHYYGGAFAPSYQLSCTRVISEGYLLTGTIFSQGVAIGVNRLGESINEHSASMMLQYALGSGAISFETKTSLPLDPTSSVKLKVSSAGPIQLSLGLHQTTSATPDRDRRWSCNLEAGASFGVGLRFTYAPAPGDLQLSLPIYISRELSSQSILLGVGLPSLLGLLVHNFILEPYKKGVKERSWERFRSQQHHLIQLRKEEAQLAVSLMSPFYERKVATERTTNGLIILAASYERASPWGSPLSDPSTSNDRWDVTIPLQILTVESQLYLPASTTKSDLLGFYDVALGEPKLLRVEYLFRGAHHRTIIKDDQALCCPLRQHLISE